MAAIVHEFDNGVILFGPRPVHPKRRSDSEEESDDHTTDAEDSFGSVTSDGTESNFQDQVEPQLPTGGEIPIAQEELQKEELLQKGKGLEKPEEHRHRPRSLSELILISCDAQAWQEDAEAIGNPSSQETQNSEPDRNQSLDHGPEHIAAAAVVVSPPRVPVAQLSWDVLPPGSPAKGVSYHKNNKQWEAHLWVQGHQLRNSTRKGVQIFMGNYSTEDEAKQAHDRAAIKFEVRTSGARPGRAPKPYLLNFHESAQADFMAEHKDWSPRDFLWKLRRYSLKFSKGRSDMKGVSVRESFRKRGRRTTTTTRLAVQDSSAAAEPVPAGTEIPVSTLRYEAKIARTDERKMICAIGTFTSEEEAGKAYDRALLFINKDKKQVEQWHVITNFRPSNYTMEEVLEAGSKLVFH